MLINTQQTGRVNYYCARGVGEKYVYCVALIVFCYHKFNNLRLVFYNKFKS